MNQYAQVIRSVGDILVHYDADQMIPVYGYEFLYSLTCRFGANVRGTVSHCFHVNSNPGNPEVYGVNGVLQAYHNSLASGEVTLYGPTNFSPVISTVSTVY